MTDVVAGSGCRHQMSSASGHLPGRGACAADPGVMGPAGNEIQHQPRLPATGTGRITAAGNARTRATAAVSLPNTLLREQENQRKKRKQASPP